MSIVRPVHEGGWFRLLEWNCGGKDPVRIRDEQCSAFEVVVVRRGAFEWDLRGTRTLLTPLHVSFWSAGDEFRVRHPVPGGDSCSIIELTPAATLELLGDSTPRSLDAAAPVFPTPANALSGTGYASHLAAFRAARTPGGSSLKVEEFVGAFLESATLRDSGVRRDPLRADSALASVAIELVAARFAERLSLFALARELGCSPFHLCRVVRRANGAGLHGVQRRLRLRHALQRVLDTRDELSRIALDAGFSSHSHFTNAFRAEFGCVPTVARAGRGASQIRQ